MNSGASPLAATTTVVHEIMEEYIHENLHNFVISVVISFVCHTLLLYGFRLFTNHSEYIRKYFPSEKKRWLLNMNFVASVHAVLAFITSLTVIHKYSLQQIMSQEWKSYFTQASAEWQRISMGITAGYMLYDLCFCLLPDKPMSNIGYCIHHVVVFTAYACAVHLNIGAYLPSLLQLGEASTPMYHLRWFLVCVELNNHVLVTVFEVFFLLVFVLIRGVFYGLLAAYPLRMIAMDLIRSGGSSSEWATVVLGIMFIALNWFWVVIAVKTALKLVETREKTQ